MGEKCFCHLNGYQVKDSVARQQIDELKNYVTPKMFGAVGDGVTDDTQALNEMFLYAKNNGLSVHLANLVYGVSGTVNGRRCNILPNNAVIKAIATMDSNTPVFLACSDYSVVVGIPDIEHTNNNQHISVDCNGLANVGVHCEGMLQSTLRYEVYNALDIGVKIINNLECVFSLCVKNKHTMLGNYGVHIDDADNTYTDILVTNFRVGVYNKGLNQFDNIHVWITTTDDYDNTVAFETTSFCTISSFYADTVRVGIKYDSSYYQSMSVGTYIYVNNKNIIPNTTEKIHTCFVMLNYAHISVDSIIDNQGYIPPQLIICENLNSVNIKEGGFGNMQFAKNTTFEYATNSFLVSTNSHPAFQSLPQKIIDKYSSKANDYYIGIRVLKIANPMMMGVDIWMCSDVQGKDELFYSIGKPTNPSDWKSLHDSNFKLVEVTTIENSYVTPFTAYARLIQSDLNLPDDSVIVSATLYNACGGTSYGVANVTGSSGSEYMKTIQVYTSKPGTYKIGVLYSRTLI